MYHRLHIGSSLFPARRHFRLENEIPKPDITIFRSKNEIFKPQAPGLGVTSLPVKK